MCLALSNQLLPALVEGGLKSPTKVKDCISNFSQLITATAQMNQPVYEAFEKNQIRILTKRRPCKRPS